MSGLMSAGGRSRGLLGLVLLASLTQPLAVARAQRGGGGRGGAGGNGRAGGPPPDTTRGFAITERAIIGNCTGCHKQDSAGVVQRISFERKTPEGWEMSVRRMVGLHHLDLDPKDARTIVRYLSDHQGLAPAEMKPARFEPERRMIDFRYTADTRTETACRAVIRWAASSRSVARATSGIFCSRRIARSTRTSTFRRSDASDPR